MKLAIPFLCLLLGVATVTTAQKAEVFKDGDLYGLKTDFGKELLPAEYVKMTKIKTDTLDFYIASLTGSAEIYSYSESKRAIYDEAPSNKFAVIQSEWVEAVKKNKIFGYDALGNKFEFKGHAWEPVKVKGMVGGKGPSGKFAVCQGGTALSGYDYLGVDAKHKECVVVLTDTGWIALDVKMKSHYDWSFDEIHNSDIHPEAFIVKKGTKWGILSLDGSMNLPPSEMKNPEGMFDFDGDSYAELNRSYAVKRAGKWGIVNQKNETKVDFRYDNAYMIDDFSIEQYGLTVHAVVKDGGTWKFLDEKWNESKSLQFDNWIGVHGEVALVMKEGKIQEVDLKTFDFVGKLYFGEYDESLVVKNEDGLSGVVSKNGEIIMPFEFTWIALEEEDVYFYVAEKNGKGGIYDKTGKVLVGHEYEGLTFLERKNEKDYFEVGLVGKVALAYWDKETNKMVLLTERVYRQVTYHFGDRMFSAETADGVFHTLDDNGKMIEEQKK